MNLDDNQDSHDDKTILVGRGKVEPPQENKPEVKLEEVAPHVESGHDDVTMLVSDLRKNVEPEGIAPAPEEPAIESVPVETPAMEAVTPEMVLEEEVPAEPVVEIQAEPVAPVDAVEAMTMIEEAPVIKEKPVEATVIEPAPVMDAKAAEPVEVLPPVEPPIDAVAGEPPKNTKKTVIIIVIVAILLLCCCCTVLAIILLITGAYETISRSSGSMMEWLSLLKV